MATRSGYSMFHLLPPSVQDLGAQIVLLDGRCFAHLFRRIVSNHRRAVTFQELECVYDKHSKRYKLLDWLCHLGGDWYLTVRSLEKKGRGV